MSMENGGSVMVVTARKGEIDTKLPFRSVKEAVSLFGDKLLAGQLHATQFKQSEEIMENRDIDEPSRHEAIEAELEETKQNLQRAKEEAMSMAHCLSSLQEELELTKQELQQLKKKSMDNNKHHPIMKEEDEEDEEEAVIIDEELEKKRYVTFANTPSLTRIISPSPQPHIVEVEKLKRHNSFGNEKKKNKIKPLIPLIGLGGIFSKKKGNNNY
ncbi:hypothetical protein PIB30_047299 [Stylosanthes scabra]|uniref:WEB family protein n=1 Tax=Stylosanthes scabra TaxID=79078 RepID=A0ABU6WGM2_9FABA|nr:hypothetical protein [Stylosanthes scabra]